jgi:hypothetical protein
MAIAGCRFALADDRRLAMRSMRVEMRTDMNEATQAAVAAAFEVL